MEKVDFPDRALRKIKIAHTAIWVFFVTVIFYILYTGFFDRVTTLTWIGIGVVIAEGLILLIYGMYCPLTLMARKYSDSKRDNFDIYLPNWLARYNKLIFTTIFLLAVILVLYRVFT